MKEKRGRMASSVYLCQMCDLGCFWLPPLSTCIYYQMRTNRLWWQPSTAKVMSTPLNSAETSFSYSHVPFFHHHHLISPSYLAKRVPLVHLYSQLLFG